MTFITNAALLLLSVLTGAQQPTPAASILAGVPDDAISVAYCADFAGLRARALRNDWFKLLFSERGEPLLADLEQEFRMQTQTEMEGLYAMAGMLQGESLLFVADQTVGFLTTPPALPAELTLAMRAWLPAELTLAMRAWLPESGTQGVRKRVQLGVARVELAAWPSGALPAWQERVGHFAAFVDHPSALGLFSADSEESLLAGIEAVLSGLETDKRSPLVEGLEEARGSATALAGIEFYIDFTSMAAKAEGFLARAAAGALPDPTGMLGLEQGTWLHASADLHPGRHVDCEAFLNIPRGTLAAALADSFSPLPADLPGRLPRDLWSVYSLQWDIGEFYATAREAFVTQEGEESVEFLDAGLMAAESMTGVNPIHDVLDLLDGTFALYFAERSSTSEVPAPANEPEFDEFRDLGLCLGLTNSDLFQEAFEKLIGVGNLESELDLIELEDFDVYTFSEPEPEQRTLEDKPNGGLAFLPGALVLCLDRDVLTRSLRASKGLANSSALDDETILGAFNDGSGACFLACVQLRPLQERFLADLPDVPAPALDPFDSLLISHGRRTPDGFRLRVMSR